MDLVELRSDPTNFTRRDLTSLVSGLRRVPSLTTPRYSKETFRTGVTKWNGPSRDFYGNLSRKVTGLLIMDKGKIDIIRENIYQITDVGMTREDFYGKIRSEPV